MYTLKGRFLSGRTISIYFSELRLDSIDLEVPGKYEISFWVLIYCSELACRLANDDFVEVSLIGENGNRIAIYRLSDSTTSMWRNNSLTFETTVPFVDVSLFY